MQMRRWSHVIHGPITHFLSQMYMLAVVDVVLEWPLLHGTSLSRLLSFFIYFFISEIHLLSCHIYVIAVVTADV